MKCIWSILSLLLLAAFPLAVHSQTAQPDRPSTAPSADAASIPLPIIPDRTFNVFDSGAIGDGKTINTAALQKAIDSATAAGGGRVVIPAGTFLTGPLTLASNIDLLLDEGATLLLSGNPDDYPLRANRYQDCISANGCHDLSISGSGAIDGQGRNWWPKYKGQPATALPHRPFLVAIHNTRRLHISGVTLQNSPMFNLVPQACRDVLIDGIKINDPSDSPNTDGIDPSGWNFLITDCRIDVGDDNIALKPSPSNASSPLRPAADSASCEDFLITNCQFFHGHGMTIGNPSAGGARRLTVRDCTFNSTDAGIRLKSQRGKGGIVEDLTYENLTMTNVKVALLITSYYPSIPAAPQDDPAQAVAASTPIWRHIHIKNVTASGGKQAGRLIGLAEMPISDLQLENVHLSAQTGLQIVNVKQMNCVDSKVTAAKGAAVLSADAEVSGLE